MTNPPGLMDVMTSDPETVQLSQPLSEVYVLLKNRSYHHVPVVDGDKPVGMIAATDILRLVYDAEGGDERLLRTVLDHQFTIEDAMSTDLATVEIGASLRQVAELMADGTIHSVLVLDIDGALAGIVTTTDLIRLVIDLV